jgi:hypothetical protein
MPTAAKSSRSASLSIPSTALIASLRPNRAALHGDADADSRNQTNAQPHAQGHFRDASEQSSCHNLLPLCRQTAKN